MFLDVVVPAKVLLDWLKLLDLSACSQETVAVHQLLEPYSREAESEVAILNDGARIKMTLKNTALNEAIISVDRYCNRLSNAAEEKIMLWVQSVMKLRETEELDESDPWQQNPDAWKPEGYDRGWAP
jgi:hypothetical protein